MISKLRKKFISITATALFILILLVITTINCVYAFQSNKMLDFRLERIMDEQKNADIFHERREQPPFDMKMMIRPDGCLIYLNADGTLKEIRQDAVGIYSEEELRTAAAEIYRSGKKSGWYRYFKFRLETAANDGGAAEIRIGMVNAALDLNSIFTMLVISVVIGMGSFLLVLLILVFASKRAVASAAESYAKQKQFVTDAGHELKSPLTVISANNELARMVYGDSEWFDGIDKQVARMNGLVRSLITLAKMDEEEKTVFVSFNLSDAVYDTAKSFENLIRAGGKRITLEIRDGIFCLGDEAKIRQVVSVLMDNAMKYCDRDGDIVVRLTEDRQSRIQIINDYAGAADCDLSRIFERFYRGDKARPLDGSYGLGLAIAKSIVELHKGEIRAKVLEQKKIMFEVILNKNIK
ncbi:MAG: HAMP domain-containing histidine kinase [Alistipes sp.]|nr:HAMP domain-containing histidine kinase [Alistipes sp.]